jgi:hypothetical protein
MKRGYRLIQHAKATWQFILINSVETKHEQPLDLSGYIEN